MHVFQIHVKTVVAVDQIFLQALMYVIVLRILSVKIVKQVIYGL
jgi:hypothetical protein